MRSLADSGQSNSESSPGSYSPSNLESNGQSYWDSYEEGDSDRSGQSDRSSNGYSNRQSN